MNNQQPIRLEPPSRSTIRLIFDMALHQAKTEMAQNAIAEAALYFEAVWQRESEQQREAEQKRVKEPDLVPAATSNDSLPATNGSGKSHSSKKR